MNAAVFPSYNFIEGTATNSPVPLYIKQSAVLVMRPGCDCFSCQYHCVQYLEL
jgi:hypothetical protein